MTNLIYFFIALGILIVFGILDAISHQRFVKKANIIFHIAGISILLVSIFILAFLEFKLSYFIFVGILAIIFGLVIAYKGLAEIKENFWEAKKVLKNKIYSKVRHPVYSGLIIFMLGFSLVVYSVFFLIYSLVAIIILILLSVYEEKHLVRKFGKTYINYKKETGMFLPKFKKAK